MINKKCNCENDVNSRKLAVPINGILGKKYLLQKKCNCFEKIGVLKK